MTERENYLLVMEGKQPAWVPNFEDAVDWIVPAALLGHFMTEEKRDFFSVPWTMNDAGPMVDTHQPPVMEDVCDWRKFVHFPDPGDLPWEETSRMQLAEHDPDKAILIMPNMGGGTIFMPLMNMMGFENGLCALLEEPEECRAFFDCVTSFYEEIIPYLVRYYHPDTIIVGDDLCSAMSPFISMETYRSILRPMYQREIDAVRREGVYAELHMCGKCEPFVYDFAEMGARSWQPAQGLNDLAAIKKRFGNDLIIVGSWNTASPVWQPGTTEDAVRAEVRQCMDRYAAGGGLVFWSGGQMGQSEDQAQKFQWTTDEARKHGKAFYAK